MSVKVLIFRIYEELIKFNNKCKYFVQDGHMVEVDSAGDIYCVLTNANSTVALF